MYPRYILMHAKSVSPGALSSAPSTSVKVDVSASLCELITVRKLEVEKSVVVSEKSPSSNSYFGGGEGGRGGRHLLEGEFMVTV